MNQRNFQTKENERKVTQLRKHKINWYATIIDNKDEVLTPILCLYASDFQVKWLKKKTLEYL